MGILGAVVPAEGSLLPKEREKASQDSSARESAMRRGAIEKWMLFGDAYKPF